MHPSRRGKTRLWLSGCLLCALAAVLAFPEREARAAVDAALSGEDQEWSILCPTPSAAPAPPVTKADYLYGPGGAPGRTSQIDEEDVCWEACVDRVCLLEWATGEPHVHDFYHTG